MNMKFTTKGDIPGYHQVSSSKKASKLHSGYNLCPISNALEQPEKVWVRRKIKKKEKKHPLTKENVLIY